jgi:hypothetical protein
MRSSKSPNQCIGSYVVGLNRPSLFPPCYRRGKRTSIPRAVWIEGSIPTSLRLAIVVHTSVWMLTLCRSTSRLGHLAFESLHMWIVSIRPSSRRAHITLVPTELLGVPVDLATLPLKACTCGLSVSGHHPGEHTLPCYRPNCLPCLFACVHHECLHFSSGIQSIHRSCRRTSR